MSRTRTSKAFTLVELLVVVSIIMLLLSLLTPSLQSARRLAREVTCASQMSQVSRAIPLYQRDWKLAEPWRFDNASGDYPWESGHSAGPGTIAAALTPVVATGKGPHYLPKADILFCPLAPLNYDDHYERLPPNNGQTFAGTYSWHFKKAKKGDDPIWTSRSSILYSNDDSRDLLMIDTNNRTWAGYGFTPRYPSHYNALFIGGDVQMISRDDSYIPFWLWGPERKPY